MEYQGRVGPHFLEGNCMLRYRYRSSVPYTNTLVPPLLYSHSRRYLGPSSAFHPPFFGTQNVLRNQIFFPSHRQFPPHGNISNFDRPPRCVYDLLTSNSAGKDPRRMLQASSIETITLSDCDDEEGTPVPLKTPEETEALQSTPSSSQNETAGNNDGNNMHLESSRDPAKSVDKNISSTNQDTATDQVTASRNQNDLEEAIKSGNHEMSMRENSKNESSDTGTTDETTPEDGTRYIEGSRRHDLTKQKLNKQPSTDRNLEYRYVQSVYFGKMRVKVSPTIPGEWALNEGNAIDQRELISPPTTTEVSLENPVGDSESNQRTTKMNRLSRNWGPLSCRIARKKLKSTKSSVVGSPRDTIPP